MNSFQTSLTLFDKQRKHKQKLKEHELVNFLKIYIVKKSVIIIRLNDVASIDFPDIFCLVWICYQLLVLRPATFY